jgi:hypothetical protein
VLGLFQIVGDYQFRIVGRVMAVQNKQKQIEEATQKQLLFCFLLSLSRVSISGYLLLRGS